MNEFTTVASRDEVGEGQLVAFDVGGQRVTVANVDGDLHAFGDVCTHARCSLSEGDLEAETVTCPCHGSQFDVTTGEVLRPPAKEPVGSFAVRIEDGQIQVAV